MEYIKRVDKYLLTQEIGRGVYGIVYKGVEDANRANVVAVKMISKKKLTNRNLEYLEREAEIIQSMKSKYIIQLIELLKTDNNYYLIFEYCDHGDLDSFRKTSGGHVDEVTARRFLRQIVKGIKVIHAKGIMHRDIKLPNVLLQKDPKNGKLYAKLGDFGFARCIKDEINNDSLEISEIQLTSSFVGTPLNMAPEIMNRMPYNYKTDIWSIGVIAFQLFTGSYPFMSHKRDELKEMLEKGIYTMPTNLELSPYAIDFFDSCLRSDPAYRMGMQLMLTHPFITLPKEDLTKPEERLEWIEMNGLKDKSTISFDTKKNEQYKKIVRKDSNQSSQSSATKQVSAKNSDSKIPKEEVKSETLKTDESNKTKSVSCDTVKKEEVATAKEDATSKKSEIPKNIPEACNKVIENKIEFHEMKEAIKEIESISLT